MSTDYFTPTAFRTWFGLAANDSNYTDAIVNPAEDEVVNRLEAWARTAWRPRVVAAQLFDGDGRAFALPHAPVSAVTVQLNSAVLTENTDYWVEYDNGVIRTPTRLPWRPQSVSVAYTYGYSVPPQEVLRPCYVATKSLIDGSKGDAKPQRIPTRVRQYQTEGTTFLLDQGEKPPEPWPWDERASDLIASLWDREREPGVYVAGGGPAPAPTLWQGGVYG